MTDALLVGVVVTAVAFGAGWKVHAWKTGAERAAELQAQQRDQLRRMERADAAAVRHETNRAALAQDREVITREVERIVERPVYRDGVCLDDDGLQQLRAALAGTTGASQPAAAVSRP